MINRIGANTLRTEDVAHKEAFWSQPVWYRQGGAPFTDTHCHCLPAFDDGPDTLRESIALCEALVADGIGTVVATAHSLGAFDGRVDCTAVRDAVNCPNQILRKDGSELTVLPGAEVRVDERICRLLDDDKILTIADGGRYLLLELPHQVFIDIEPLLAELDSSGITALIAHPERNAPLMMHHGVLHNWVERGAVLQITAASLAGDCGLQAEKAAWYLLANSLVSVIATDAHDAYCACPRMGAAFTLIEEQYGRDLAKLLCIEKPSRIVASQDIKPSLEDYGKVVNR